MLALQAHFVSDPHLTASAQGSAASSDTPNAPVRKTSLRHTLKLRQGRESVLPQRTSRRLLQNPDFLSASPCSIQTETLISSLLPPAVSSPRENRAKAVNPARSCPVHPHWTVTLGSQLALGSTRGCECRTYLSNEMTHLPGVGAGGTCWMPFTSTLPLSVAFNFLTFSSQGKVSPNNSSGSLHGR